MSLQIVAYSDAHAVAWDDLCAQSINATFLHTRKFLSYHGSRFEDASALIYASNELVGVLPAALAPHDRTLVISHPGATYGGVVHDGWLSGERMLDAMTLLVRHYRSRGYASLLYKPVPYAYAASPAQDDLYALFRLRGACVRRDLSCTIDLAQRRPASERRRRGLRKAQRTVTLDASDAYLTRFWEVLATNLAGRHGATPTHNAIELRQLQALFPQQIQLRSAMLDRRVEAGVLLFNSPMVWHAQYIAASPVGQAACALDAIFEQIIDEASEAGARYFDFGISNEQGGWHLNEGLYRFKHEFGGGGTVHEHYLLDVTCQPLT